MKPEEFASRPPRVLLVEDDPGDVLLIQEAFRRGTVPVELHQVENGEDCLAFLKKEGPHAGAPSPDLILLDLNMPSMDGRETLLELLADEKFCHLPIILLTTSANDQDVLEMYSLRCSSYIVKPLDFEGIQRITRAISDYWFGVAKLAARQP